MTHVAPTDGLKTEFAGQRPRLFKLALVASFWTVLTLGFYRFWMKTRLRRWYWSSIRPGGLPLEYVGDPFEKLLGFFMAVVVLAFYIGVVNLILMFASLSLFSTNFTAYAASLIGVIPVWFYARYRARRYVLARTRWRGVRFGLEPGAWGYAGRALWHWLITLLSAGILWPRKTFYLEKYRTDRTVFGSATLHQGGSWTMLMPAYVHVLIAAVVLAVAAGALAQENNAVAMVGLVGVPYFIFGMIHYSVTAKRLLANHKSAGDVRLSAEPKVGTAVRIYVFGYLATVLVCMLPALPITVMIGVIEMEKNGLIDSSVPSTGEIYGLPTTVWTVLGVIAYFVIMLLWFVLRHCFVTMPIWRHYAETLTIENADSLEDVSQKDRDEFREAEGFAEALDLWGAI
ncbi:YjgN family protein [Octadecabacter sp.]|nr:YjgN family protein [Octadecabacter sp.]